jgi:carboxyl-terminal processing protease
VNRRELLESALKGMLQNLDPHSQFITQTEWKSFRKQIEGRYGGIGITVENDPDTERLKVIAPMVGTPAYTAGVLSGDLIVEIDGHSTEGFGPDRAAEILTGRVGTPVILKVRHEGDNSTEVLTMNRSFIDVPSVLGDTRKADDTWDFMLDKERKIGYVRITSFIQNTTEELKHALADLKEQGMKGLILDLRDNPGGLLSAAVEVSDLFVDEGLIVSTKGRNTPKKEYEAQKDALYTDFPMVVLVNGGSASASEILSACLQDHKRAKVVGTRSFGKGSVQNIIELEDGNSVLKLTVASYFRPSGKNIHRFKNAKDSDEWGVTPDKDLAVKLTTEQYISYMRGRRTRDLISSRRARAKPEAKTTEGDKLRTTEVAKAEAKPVEPPKDEVKPKKTDAPTAKPEKPAFSDVQRDKALAVMTSELDAAAAKK